jgi:hypothetical protein
MNTGHRRGNTTLPHEARMLELIHRGIQATQFCSMRNFPVSLSARDIK